MNLSKWIDIFVGMAFVYWVLAATASFFVEWFSKLINQRGEGLRQFIWEMLAGQGPVSTNAAAGTSPAFVEGLLNHATLRSLWKPKIWRSDEATFPSYIPGPSFARALLDQVLKVGDPTSPAAGTESAPRRWTTQDVTDALSKAGDQIPAPLREVIQTHVAGAMRDMDKLEKDLAAWYDASMDRATGWYRRWSTRILFFVILALTTLFNIDSLAIFRTVAQDSTARSVLSQAGYSAYDGSVDGQPRLVGDLAVLALVEQPVMRPLLENVIGQSTDAAAIERLRWMAGLLAQTVVSPRAGSDGPPLAAAPQTQLLQSIKKFEEGVDDLRLKLKDEVSMSGSAAKPSALTEGERQQKEKEEKEKKEKAAKLRESAVQAAAVAHEDLKRALHAVIRDAKLQRDNLSAVASVFPFATPGAGILGFIGLTGHKLCEARGKEMPVTAAKLYRLDALASKATSETRAALEKIGAQVRDLAARNPAGLSAADLQRTIDAVVRQLPQDSGELVSQAVTSVVFDLRDLSARIAGGDCDKLRVPHWDKLTLAEGLMRVSGWLLTILLVSLGAPFWFDLLSNLASLRQAGPRPAESGAGTPGTP